MEAWVTGWLIALGIGLFKAVTLLASLASIRARNFRRINVFYNPWLANFSSVKPVSWASGLAFMTWVLVVGPLFSWLSVVSFAIQILIHWQKQSPLPEKLKEINYRLANIVLTEEEVRVIVAEFASFATGKSVAPIPSLVNLPEIEDVYGDGERLDLILSDEHTYSILQIRRTAKTFEWSIGPADRAGTHFTKGEYRIDGDGQVFMRTTDSRFEGYGEIEMKIQNGVVCEETVRNSYKDGFMESSVEDRIAELHEETKWQFIGRTSVRWFVAGAHPEIVTPAELRRLMNSEIEKLRLAPKLANSYANQMRCDLVEAEFGYDFHRRNDNLRDNKIDLQGFSDEALRMACGATLLELNNSKKSIETLEKYLGVLQRAA